MAVIGSWKIIAIFSPRSRLRPCAGCFSTSVPCSSTWPATAFSARGGLRPMTAKAVTDFPEPDSPTTQTSSPAFTEKLTPSTAKDRRSEEHTSELQSLMRISYAVFCLKKKQHIIPPVHNVENKKQIYT